MRKIEIENRKVLITREDRDIAIVGENGVEKIVFSLSRRQGEADLSETTCTVAWKSENYSNIENLPLAVNGGKVEVSWLIGKDETAGEGSLLFELSFVKNENGEDVIVYKTIQNNFTVIKSLSAGVAPPAEYPDVWSGILAARDDANLKAAYAQEQGGYAQAQGVYAEEQGNFAKEKGEYAEEVGSGLQGQINSLNERITSLGHFHGYFATNAEIMAVTNADANDYAYSAESKTKWIFDGEWTDSGVPVPDQTVEPSDNAPLSNGTPSAGFINKYSRGDHVHPEGTVIKYVVQSLSDTQKTQARENIDAASQTELGNKIVTSPTEPTKKSVNQLWFEEVI